MKTLVDPICSFDDIFFASNQKRRSTDNIIQGFFCFQSFIGWVIDWEKYSALTTAITGLVVLFCTSSPHLRDTCESSVVFYWLQSVPLSWLARPSANGAARSEETAHRLGEPVISVIQNVTQIKNDSHFFFRKYVQLDPIEDVTRYEMRDKNDERKNLIKSEIEVKLGNKESQSFKMSLK